MYYKNVIQKNQLRPNDLYTKFDGKTARKEFVDICETINPWWTEADAKSLYALNVGPRIFDSVSNVDLVKIYKDPNEKLYPFRKTNAEKWERDKLKNQLANKLGIKLITVWENDYVNYQKTVLKNIKLIINESVRLV